MDRGIIYLQSACHGSHSTKNNTRWVYEDIHFPSSRLTKPGRIILCGSFIGSLHGERWDEIRLTFPVVDCDNGRISIDTLLLAEKCRGYMQNRDHLKEIAFRDAASSWFFDGTSAYHKKHTLNPRLSWAAIVASGSGHTLLLAIILFSVHVVREDVNIFSSYYCLSSLDSYMHRLSQFLWS